ncbi:WYL domain-containing protein [Orrella sp. NBD-18]|uniref:WYL domain-containing protein n=1 Tax=Sheuella amnicola TaxID=2707330 RepID=A0A6B2R4Q7_9BURK|nr:WYL domain-containing protein [Sheuella amnicola]NDY84449.1 WYL domain-containing protein [Sheuella amnicola]
MSSASQIRQQKLIDSIPENGTAKTIGQLAIELRPFYALRDIDERSVKARIRSDVELLKLVYKDLLECEGGRKDQSGKKSITVKWKNNSRPLNRVALSTAQMIAFATIKKMGTHLLPRHMEDSLSVFTSASENEAISQSSALNPQAGDRKNRSAAQKWLSKIQSVPERIEFIEPDVSPDVEEKVHRALMEESAIDIKYRNNQNWKSVSPLGIAQQGARTYLVALYQKQTTPITLLLARIRDVRQSTAIFESPEGFKLDAYLAKGIAKPESAFLSPDKYGKDIKLKLWVKGDTQWLKETPLSRDQWTELCDSDQPQGDYILSATVRMTEGLVWWLLSMSYHVKVLGPQHLIKRLQHDLQLASQNYSSKLTE